MKEKNRCRVVGGGLKKKSIPTGGELLDVGFSGAVFPEWLQDGPVSVNDAAARDTRRTLTTDVLSREDVSKLSLSTGDL